jgi:hypothetical protein
MEEQERIGQEKGKLNEQSKDGRVWNFKSKSREEILVLNSVN